MRAADADVLIGVGTLSKHYSPDYWYETSDACADRMETLVREGDCVLVKGSASARMGQIVKKLRAVAEIHCGLH